MADAAQGPRPRPISPQVQLNGGVWRWQLTMAAAILHLVTGCGLYIGALAMLVWALALASGPDAYAAYLGLAASPLGKLGFLILTLCVFYHLANGVRHLVWDAGYGFKPQTATQSAAFVIGFTIVATIVYWTFLAWAGAL